MGDGRREAERRLVEHDQFRRAHQAAADREHLLLAAGERAGRLPLRARRAPETAPARACDFRRAARARAAAARPFRDSRRPTASEKSAGLRPPGRCRDCRRDSSASRRCRSRANTMRPRAGRMHAGDGADQRSLAGAVGADDGDDRALARCRAIRASSACASP